MKLCCFLFGHKWVFAYREFSHTGLERRRVEVVCARCGEVIDSFWARIDNEGNGELEAHDLGVYTNKNS